MKRRSSSMASRPDGCFALTATGFVGAAAVGVVGAAAVGVVGAAAVGVVGAAAVGVADAAAGACSDGAAAGTCDDGAAVGGAFRPGAGVDPAAGVDVGGLAVDGAGAFEGRAERPTGTVRRIVTWIAPLGLVNSTWKFSSKCSRSMTCGFVSSDEIWNGLSDWFAI
jgi:hypothetical protein